MDELRLLIEDGTASLVIDRPDRRNAFTRAMWDELPRLLDQACSTAGVRVVVVRSAVPGIFSAGADIGEYRAHIGDVPWGIDNQETVSAATAAVRSAPLPVIAAVDGPAFGAGAGLVASCDLRIATDRSTFAITPARLGVVYPFPDTAALVDLVGPAHARRILLTGSTFEAAEAQQIGFLDDVVTPEQLERAVAQHAAVLAANSLTSMRLMKAQVRLAAAGQKVDDDTTRAFVREALEGSDYAEGAQAFLERRPPRFV